MKHLMVMFMLGLTSVGAALVPNDWAGLYRKPDGSFIGIGDLEEFGKGDVYVDYAKGEAGRIFPLPDGKAGISHAIGLASPPPVHTLERRAGDVLLDGEKLAVIPLIRRPFAVKNGSVTLAGELVRTAKDPLGVLIVVPGSGDGPRRAYDIWTNYFLSQGWAVVVTDKRGSGQSTGDWHDANFHALAGDVRSVITWTRAQPEAKGVKVGLWGISQAGWIIPQVAAEATVDFAIVQAGPATAMDDYNMQALESELQAYGFTSDDIKQARAYYALDVAVSRGEQPFSAIEAAYRKASAAKVEWILKPPDQPNTPDRRFIAAIGNFDPAPYLRQIHIPYLALFGGKDHVVPAEQNRPIVEKLLAEAGNKQAEIKTLPDDNHLNLIAKTGVRTEYPGLNRIDPAYFATLTDFLRRMGQH